MVSSPARVRRFPATVERGKLPNWFASTARPHFGHLASVGAADRDEGEIRIAEEMLADRALPIEKLVHVLVIDLGEQGCFPLALTIDDWAAAAATNPKVPFSARLRKKSAGTKALEYAHVYVGKTTAAIGMGTALHSLAPKEITPPEPLIPPSPPSEVGYIRLHHEWCANRASSTCDGEGVKGTASLTPM
jgi:hypothetical protein